MCEQTKFYTARQSEAFVYEKYYWAILPTSKAVFPFTFAHRMVTVSLALQHYKIWLHICCPCL